ncbi:phospholipase A [Sphingosinithalassobacter sp. CS137]|uniref:phospholipase A n=1 Tax=Sphingosinithalassobacter sp. CS137 TaxID=2762748 RepID=UPI00165E3D67|nr:phospholipase A [Sphingosinithalassobacter sp. CS137]
MRRRLLLAPLLAATAFPAAAQVRTVPVQPASEREALGGVEVYLVNEGEVPVSAQGPRQIEVTAADGTRLVLERLPAPERSVAPGGFAKLRYVPVGLAEAAVPRAEAFPPARLPEPGETVVQSATGSSAGFLDRFSPHEPVYGAFGLGDSGAKLQVSFAFQPIGGEGALSNLRFGYTQTMFWALDQDSGPFRATTYSPEVYADVPVGDASTLALGWRHDSNGRGAVGSIDANRIFARIEHRIDLGGDWRLDLAPQAWFYVGKQGAAPDLADYWGYMSITAALSRPDGLKIAVTGRGNFETGRGAAELFVSWPLARIDDRIGAYLFGQAFTGDGEVLDEFRVEDSHVRVGIALTR